MSGLRLYASAPGPLCSSLQAEIEACGATDVRIRGAGVEFRGSLEVAYRTCLWSRVASRVLLEISCFPAPDPDELYACSARIPWDRHLSASTTFAVSCTTHNARITHTHFAALRVKDAVVDWFRSQHGRRPDVDTVAPGVQLHLHMRGGEGRLYLDLAGNGLHRRGYRDEAGPAPLRETLAAAMLYLAEWPRLSLEGRILLDPMCGAGTLIIEAALMSGDIAPGSLRRRFGFHGWQQHDEALWQGLLDEARHRREHAAARLQHAQLVGRDIDPACVRIAIANAERAGVANQVRFECGPIAEAPGIDRGAGVLVSNPPYGQRLEDVPGTPWRDALEGGFPGWRIAVILPRDAPRLRGADYRALEVRNGALECRIDRVDHEADAAALDVTAFANRIAKRSAHLRRWARRHDVQCYRIYDADLPDYALAVDLYHADETWLHVTEYEAPAHIDPVTARRRLEAGIDALIDCTAVPRSRIVVKRRQRQRGASQYQRANQTQQLLEIGEHGARLLVNLVDFLDTGLFLDHRATRRWIGQHAAGVRFLNLFAYTGSASVHAALGGARRTLSLDMSRTYCEWARRNLSRNGFAPPRHEVLEADCIEWLERGHDDEAFDLIFLDPPTFSNSKRMRSTLDIQRDHPRLIQLAMDRLAPHGRVVFSCNRRGFRLDTAALSGCTIRDLTRASLDEDFARTQPPPHQCYHLTRLGAC